MQERPEQARHLKRAALSEWQGVFSCGRNVDEPSIHERWMPAEVLRAGRSMAMPCAAILSEGPPASHLLTFLVAA